MKRFRHNDMEHLEKVLAIAAGGQRQVGHRGRRVQHGRRSGAAARASIAFAKQYGARLMVDDAHGLGVHRRGRGTSAHFGVTDQVDLIMGTFSKSFASLGGFIAGEDQVIDYIQHSRPLAHLQRQHARPPTPPPRWLRWRSWSRAGAPRSPMAITEKMRDGYRSMGFDIGNTETPMVPIIIGDEMKTLQMWKTLFEAGVYTNPVLPPASRPASRCCAPATWPRTPTTSSIAYWRPSLQWARKSESFSRRQHGHWKRRILDRYRRGFSICPDAPRLSVELEHCFDGLVRGLLAQQDAESRVVILEPEAVRQQGCQVQLPLRQPVQGQLVRRSVLPWYCSSP